MSIQNFKFLVYGLIIVYLLFIPTSAVTCPSGKVDFEGTCLSECPTSYYYSEFTQKCETCSFGCAECTGLKASECTACHPGFTKKHGGCYCFSEAFYTISSRQSDNTCTSGYPLRNPQGDFCYTCLSLCPNNYFLDARDDYQCKLCDITCETCFGETGDQCLRCASGLEWDAEYQVCISPASCPYNNIVQDFCSSENCTSNQIFDHYNQICVTGCSGTKVMPIDFTTPKGQCLACDSSCRGNCVSEFDSTYCTEGCNGDFEPTLVSRTEYDTLSKTLNVHSCSSIDLKINTDLIYSSDYGMYVQCLSHCSTCDKTIEKCLTCSTREYVTEDGDCIDYCPTTTHQVLEFESVTYCWSKDDINVEAASSYNSAAKFVIPILTTLNQVVYPFSSSGFVRPIMFNLMVSIKYLLPNLDISIGAKYVIGNMSLISPTIMYPTPGTFVSPNQSYFWANFWPYLINYCVMCPFVVWAYFLNKGKERIKSKTWETIVKHYCDFFLMNFPISFTLATMPDLILYMLVEFVGMGSAEKSVYFFYSLIFNSFYGIAIVASWMFVLLPSVCSAHAAMKVYGKLPDKYERIRVIYGDIKIETQRAMFFFFLFFLRAIIVIFLTLSFQGSPTTALIARMAIGGAFLVMHPLLRPWKSSRRAIEYFLYDLTIVSFDVVCYMNTQSISSLSNFDNVALKSLYANMIVICLYVMMSLQIAFCIFELLSPLFKTSKKIYPSNTTQTSNVDPQHQHDPAIATRDIQLLQDLPSGPSQTEGFRNLPPTQYNNSSGLAHQNSDNHNQGSDSQEQAQSRDRSPFENRQEPEHVEEIPGRPVEGSVMKDYSTNKGLKDSHDARQDRERLVDDNAPRDFEGRSNDKGSTKKFF